VPFLAGFWTVPLNVRVLLAKFLSLFAFFPCDSIFAGLVSTFRGTTFTILTCYRAFLLDLLRVALFLFALAVITFLVGAFFCAFWAFTSITRIFTSISIARTFTSSTGLFTLFPNFLFRTFTFLLLFLTKL